jgi:hypothetical protein
MGSRSSSMSSFHRNQIAQENLSNQKQHTINNRQSSNQISAPSPNHYENQQQNQQQTLFIATSRSNSQTNIIRPSNSFTNLNGNNNRGFSEHVSRRMLQPISTQPHRQHNLIPLPRQNSVGGSSVQSSQSTSGSGSILSQKIKNEFTNKVKSVVSNDDKEEHFAKYPIYMIETMSMAAQNKEDFSSIFRANKPIEIQGSQTNVRNLIAAFEQPNSSNQGGPSNQGSSMDLRQKNSIVNNNQEYASDDLTNRFNQLTEKQIKSKIQQVKQQQQYLVSQAAQNLSTITERSTENALNNYQKMLNIQSSGDQINQQTTAAVTNRQIKQINNDLNFGGVETAALDSTGDGFTMNSRLFTSPSNSNPQYKMKNNATNEQRTIRNNNGMLFVQTEDDAQVRLSHHQILQKNNRMTTSVESKHQQMINNKELNSSDGRKNVPINESKLTPIFQPNQNRHASDFINNNLNIMRRNTENDDDESYLDRRQTRLSQTDCLDENYNVRFFKQI